MFVFLYFVNGPEIQPFTKQQPVEGSRFVLSCFVSGKPAPTSQQIWWTRQNDNTFRQQGNQLVIDNIQKEQSGIYTCHAQNTLTPSGQSSINKTATKDVEVDVLYKPVLTTSPNFNPLILYVGQQNVQMTCSSTQANPSSVEYWWTYNKQNYNGPVYNLQTVTKTSGGNYICNGRNTVGTSSCTVSVVVQYGPTIDPVSPQKFIAGRYTSVSCVVNSYPVADITWSGPNNLQQTGQILIFKTTTKSHRGIYNCTATNKLTPSGHSVLNKQQQINVDIDILYRPEIMDIPSLSIVEGEILTLTCPTRANPTAHSYKWTKIGDNTFQQLSKTLVITNIRRTQSGKYKCTAINTMTPTNGQTETGEGHGEVTVNVKLEDFLNNK
ncbi:hypothetical protein KUTeg_005934 [Tegillarca granosa]|uniref:Ig-like domain-containing protein n=1 Tax=Tegillarca granosa TaxID=220873 RepID=A0ABQ9FKR4_TEGGR|nr:hypothetical protein KUTeg_005934 [Tegillarca granosa]